jgi:hypothetical protein
MKIGVPLLASDGRNFHQAATLDLGCWDAIVADVPRSAMIITTTACPTSPFGLRHSEAHVLLYICRALRVGLSLGVRGPARTPNARDLPSCCPPSPSIRGGSPVGVSHVRHACQGQ